MKYTILLLITTLLIANCCISQEATSRDVNHEFVVIFPSLKKDALFEKSLQWVNRCKSDSVVCDYTDKERGTIVVRNCSMNILRPDIRMKFTIIFGVNNENAQLRFVNLRPANVNDTVYAIITAPYHQAAQEQFKILVKNFTDYVNAK